MKKLKKVDGFCAPMALKYLSGLSDEIVHEICASNGFSQEYGMDEFEFLESARELKIRYRRVSLKRAELYHAKISKFLAKYPKGIYLIYTGNHLFVVDDSSIIDPLNPTDPGLSQPVVAAWKVFK